ncbi:MFS general substrate transporter [Hesseltinella vesiculosa]|uniref:MFS general substrate transporter n=1 Tax=Hesseltinella vesiculosa TaxID=101127 RepID=A0A1X2G7S2_9FUNG|nr:MFS general substrate transporter [Hesseltinella vesiculosa]
MGVSSTHQFIPLACDDNESMIVAMENENNHSTMDEVLDALLAKVGYGRFHTTLLVLCGFGWLADNMWLQTVAMILPRVQEHFSVDDKWIGSVSSALFMGMMFGSFFWGNFSDKRGRRLPYTMTLVITSVFGILSSFAFSFWSLCLLLFCLGFGVGGNMPTDGALYLEFLPKEYHYLLTFMSVFFSFGAVLASVLGYMILPYTSCPEPTAENVLPDCDLATQNTGWRIMLFSVGVVTLIMLAARSFCLRLPETPKYLLNHARRKETIIVLQDIAKFNGNHDVDIQDCDLHHQASPPATAYEDHDDTDANERDGLLTSTQSYSPTPPSSPHDNDVGLYATVATTHHRASGDLQQDASSSLVGHKHTTSPTLTPVTTLTPDQDSVWTILLSDHWRRTVFLVWGIWAFTSMAYTMFNVFLPKYLETLGFDGESVPTRKDVYWDYMIYSIAGVPGSVLASYMIETRLGRKGTMALSAFGSALSLFFFSIISSRITMLISSSAVSFLATLLYAVIYGYTPEVFDTNIRGTAVGSASGLGRVAGIISPILSGVLLTVRMTLPLYVSVAGFVMVGICILLLPYETRSRASSSVSSPAMTPNPSN